jgi:3-oxoacyl-[acyl-carrier protein] reductase
VLRPAGRVGCARRVAGASVTIQKETQTRTVATCMKSLAQKVALITGVTRRQGIGAAIAFALAQAGADICTAYYRPYDRKMPWGVEDAEPEQILSALRQTGIQAHGFEIDLGEPEGPRTLCRLVRERFGRLDILVNNAVYSTETTVETMTTEDLDRHYAINLRAVMLLCLEFVNGFPQGAAGRIINLTSGQGLAPMPHELAYAATKGGVDAFTLSLSAATAGRGITVNAVDPGPTDTGWLRAEQRAALLARAPMGRLGAPQDAARVVAFLASEEAGWVTGQVIRSRGGT